MAYGTIEDLADELVYGYWRSTFRRPASWTLDDERTLAVNLTGLDREASLRAKWALDVWSHYIGIDFDRVRAGGDIRFVEGEGSDAYAQRRQAGGELTKVRITIGEDRLDGMAKFGDIGYITILHELGHALGLGHPGHYNGDARYFRDAIYRSDTVLRSAMSYFDADKDRSYSDRDLPPWLDPVTPMAADIRAIEMLYGSHDVNRGATIYNEHTFDTGIGGSRLRLSSSDLSQANLITLKDDGGHDLLEMTALFGHRPGKHVIDLTPGAISTVSSADAPVVFAIYETTIIEDVEGTRNADRITGNAVDNKIRARNGEDVLRGEGGDDHLRGGKGADRLGGGTGNDILNGGPGDEVLFGGAGDDKLWGSNGEDTFVFRSARGEDVVMDFRNDVDTLDLSRMGYENRREVRSQAEEVERGLRLGFEDGHGITLRGMTWEDLRDDILI
ncbi:M10 family metallopeptidase C-terminal domain-containing protein [uncultured Jannaschia sp.]|uniref:M10 family metallopeptidase C-terminal domain-containing protein n=1 Tax=uncultured Jannaschia sp. TaxID=293347 RepID=UPI00263786C3|nr:M10 family metallopeptidase C-terminal domain-containing protein [uncultured Jannaschia sp.]